MVFYNNQKKIYAFSQPPPPCTEKLPNPPPQISNGPSLILNIPTTVQIANHTRRTVPVLRINIQLNELLNY